MVLYLVFRLGICKNEVGNQDGSQWIREAIRIATLAGIGKPESRENGTHALIYSVRSLLISNSSELNSFFGFLFFSFLLLLILFSNIFTG